MTTRRDFLKTLAAGVVGGAVGAAAVKEAPFHRGGLVAATPGDRPVSFVHDSHAYLRGMLYEPPYRRPEDGVWIVDGLPAGDEWLRRRYARRFAVRDDGLLVPRGKPLCIGALTFTEET